MVAKFKEPKKALIVYILKLLEYHSDAKHPWPQVKICDEIRNNFMCDRKTVARNIQALIDMGYPIVKTRQGVYMGNKAFTLEEVDTVVATNSSSISTNATNISTNASNITKITNGTTVVGKTKVLENQADAMTTNYTPAQYRSLYPNCTLVEKKNSSTIGLSIGNTVSMLLTIVPNNNWPVSQIAISTSYMYIRTEDTSSTWYAWQKIQLPSDVSSALTSINSSISSINSSISTLSSKDTSLQSSINSLSSSVSSLQTQINNMLNGTTTFTLLKVNNINLV